MKKLPRIVLALCCLFTALTSEGAHIWQEGENPVEQNVVRHPWWFDSVKTNLLSGGAWISNFSAEKKGEVVYEVNVEKNGLYTLWVRLVPTGTQMFYQIDGSAKLPIDLSRSPQDLINVAGDGKVDLRFLAWFNLGKLDLGTGKHRIRFFIESPGNHHGAIDCFCLTTDPWMPVGTRQPGQKTNKATPGWWSFEPEIDPLNDSALLNLRSLNEKVAGESGFVRRKGDTLVLGKGDPVRFWGVNVGPDLVRMSPEQVDYLAARLAKMGVNAVRIHGPLVSSQKKNLAEIDGEYFERLHYFIHALKKQGIYSTLSIYFPLWFDLTADHGFPGYAPGKKPFALLYFNSDFQKIYRSWWKALLTQSSKTVPNARPLAQESAVMLLEMVNEDSLFFWTFTADSIPDPYLSEFEKQFAQWAISRHGSLEKLKSQWGDAKLPRDGTSLEKAAFYEPWQMTVGGSRQGSDAKRKRVADQIQFLFETQSNFYKEIAQYLKQELGSRSMVSASNWITVDPALLDPLERLSYQGADVLDRHGYFQGKHEGDRAGYSVEVGQTYEDRTALLDPAQSLIPVVQYAGFPYVMSELGWPQPNRYRADNTFLISAYGSLQGMDGYFYFALNAHGWASAPPKFAVSVPSVLGQFPAAALQYRRGDINPGSVIVRERLSTQQLFQQKPSAGGEAHNLDALRAADGQLTAPASRAALHPLSFLVGRVERSFGEIPEFRSQDLSEYIRPAEGTVQSVGGQLLWNHRAGWSTVNTPRSRGVTGFLSRAGVLKLGELEIQSTNDYGSIQVISLDGEPLESSHKVLVQIFTEEQPFGFTTEGAQITSLGEGPWNIRDIAGELKLRNAVLRKATTLDENGYRKLPVRLTHPAGTLTLRLPTGTLYTVLEP